MVKRASIEDVQQSSEERVPSSEWPAAPEGAAERVLSDSVLSAEEPAGVPLHAATVEDAALFARVKRMVGALPGLPSGAIAMRLGVPFAVVAGLIARASDEFERDGWPEPDPDYEDEMEVFDGSAVAPADGVVDLDAARRALREAQPTVPFDAPATGRVEQVFETEDGHELSYAVVARLADDGRTAVEIAGMLGEDELAVSWVLDEIRGEKRAATVLSYQVGADGELESRDVQVEMPGVRRQDELPGFEPPRRERWPRYAGQRVEKVHVGFSGVEVTDFGACERLQHLQEGFRAEVWVTPSSHAIKSKESEGGVELRAVVGLVVESFGLADPLRAAAPVGLVSRSRLEEVVEKAFGLDAPGMLDLAEGEEPMHPADRPAWEFVEWCSHLLDGDASDPAASDDATKSEDGADDGRCEHGIEVGVGCASCLHERGGMLDAALEAAGVGGEE